MITKCIDQFKPWTSIMNMVITLLSKLDLGYTSSFYLTNKTSSTTKWTVFGPYTILILDFIGSSINRGGRRTVDGF